MYNPKTGLVHPYLSYLCAKLNSCIFMFRIISCPGKFYVFQETYTGQQYLAQDNSTKKTMISVMSMPRHNGLDLYLMPKHHSKLQLYIIIMFKH